MNTKIDSCCRSTESQFLLRTVSNCCSLLFLSLVLATSSWFIQSVSAQTPSGTLKLVGPAEDPSPNAEFVVRIEIENPQNIGLFNMTIKYSDDLSFSSDNPVQPGEGQFNINHLSIGTEGPLENGRRNRNLNLRNNTGDISEGTLMTIKFQASGIGNHQIEISGGHLYDRALSNETEINRNDVNSLTVPVRGPLQGTVNLVPRIGDVRVGETSLIDIELHDRSRAHSYEITVDPSANLGPLIVSYNSDDTNVTVITNHTAGDAITIGADLWLPNAPLDNIIDWRMTHSDPIVATLFFTPTATGVGSFEITEARIFDPNNTALTLSNPDTLTFTITEARQHITQPNTGVGPTPIIEVSDGTKDGPFEIEIYFVSENYIEQLINADASIQFPRGVYGFARDEIEVGGTAGASVTTRLWEADGAQIYYARINPTETGSRQVTLQVPAGVVREVGTNLPNVASEIVTLNTNLAYPPWDVSENGRIERTDVELVEEALGQGLKENGPNFAFYRNTIEDPRRDVNGDLYINQVDIDLVRMHIPAEEGGAQGQSRERRQARSIEPPDASTWMPDANLRKAVRKSLGIGTDENFTQEQLATLTKLLADKTKISDITGLEHATSLRKLELRYNKISDIGSLEGLIELRELAIGHNNISDISAFAGLTKLTHIGLSSNKVSDIAALEDLTNLKELWLRDNKISDITALGNLTKLTYLNLKNNEISDITALGNLTKLQELWMANNNIRDVSPLSSLIKLKKLGLADNPILDTSPLFSLTQGALKKVDISISEYPPWDVNEDGSVDETDSALVTAALGQSGADIVDSRTDVNGDGTVDQDDLTLVTDNINADGNAPSNMFALLDRETLETLDPEVLERYLNILRAESDGSLKYLRAIALLESVLSVMRPEKTQLLANYPNPFNPETWIPYHLANPSTVRITIYNTRGVIVRRLDLGHQQAGYYTHRSRAAYWDGRNDLGERIASGIYFYQFQAGSISSLRKLLILK